MSGFYEFYVFDKDKVKCDDTFQRSVMIFVRFSRRVYLFLVFRVFFSNLQSNFQSPYEKLMVIWVLGRVARDLNVGLARENNRVNTFDITMSRMSAKMM